MTEEFNNDNTPQENLGSNPNQEQQNAESGSNQEAGFWGNPIDSQQVPPQGAEAPLEENTFSGQPISDQPPFSQTSYPNYQVPLGGDGGGPEGRRKENIILPIISFIVSFLVLVLSWLTSIPLVFFIIAFLGILFAGLAIILNWKRKKLLSIIAIGVASLVFFISGAAVLVSVLQEEVQTGELVIDDDRDDEDDDDLDDEDLIVDESSTDIKDYMADEDDYAFKWEMDDLESLEAAPYDSSDGTSLQTIFEEFGKGSNATIRENGDYLTVEYEDKEQEYDGARVVLHFTKEDGQYILSSATGQRFTTDLVETVSEDSYQSKWTQKDVDDLAVAEDNSTGEGGAKLSDIIQKYDKPTEATESITIYGDRVTKTLRIGYIGYGQDDDSKLSYVALDFVTTNDKDYLLIYKYPDSDSD